MNLDASEVIEFLKSRGSRYLYHANSVITSCTFLENGSLLSRGAVEKLSVPQTPQSSDKIDRIRRIWNDVFVDAVDIHDRAYKRNLYGPVLFVLDIETLSRPPVTEVWITKKNPIHWKSNEPRKERFYTSINELKSNYTVGDFGAMLLFRNIDGELPLKSNLRYLLIDNPGSILLPVRTETPLPASISSLRKSARLGGLKYLRFRIRECSKFCQCHDEYYTYPTVTLDLFKG